MFSLHFREQIASIKQVLLDELDQIVASAQSRWSAQHDQSGAHGAVTATSVSSSGLTSSALWRSPLTGNTQLTTFDDYVPNETVQVEPGKTFYWFDRNPIAPAACVISRLIRPGSQTGDVIFISEPPRGFEFGSTTGIYLGRFNDTPLTLGNEGRFLFPRGATTSITTGDGTNNYRVIELNGDTVLPFIYVKGQVAAGTNSSADGAWVLIGYKDY